MSSENNPAASPISPSSLKQKLKSSLRLPWLCHNSRHRDQQHQQLIALSASTSTPLPTSANPSPTANNHSSKSSLRRTSSSTWFKSPELKDKCRDLINRIGYGPGHNRSHGHGHHCQGRRRRCSADFRYDPASYALNFDEGCDSQLDEFPSRNFSARLPPSPIATSSRETTTYKL